MLLPQTSARRDRPRKRTIKGKDSINAEAAKSPVVTLEELQGYHKKSLTGQSWLFSLLDKA